MTLTRVYTKRDAIGARERGVWLMWEWETRGLSMPEACGYSGVVLKNETAPNDRNSVEVAGEYFLVLQTAATS